MTDDRIKLGVLWKNLSREGNKPYLSGRIQHDSLDDAVQLMRDGGRFLVLGNTKRPDKQDPDYVLYVVPERRQNEQREAEPRLSNPPASPQRGRLEVNAGTRGRR